MKTGSNVEKSTPERIWAILDKIAISQAESDRLRQENERILNEKFAETDRKFAETDRKMKELQKIVGGITNNQGSFAEEYFFNSFEQGKQNFFGEKFDEITKNVSNFWQGLKDEYDIVLYNHTSVALIEVKYKAHLHDIPEVVKKAETFRILFPNYKDFKIYLGLASLSFYAELEQKCTDEGVAVIKQVGDKVIINDKHIKVY